MPNHYFSFIWQGYRFSVRSGFWWYQLWVNSDTLCTVISLESANKSISQLKHVVPKANDYKLRILGSLLKDKKSRCNKNKLLWLNPRKFQSDSKGGWFKGQREWVLVVDCWLTCLVWSRICSTPNSITADNRHHFCASEISNAICK